MKTSLKLLIGLFLAIVVTMFATAVSLRHQYDSIDKKDPYSRWKAISLPSFHAIKLIGPTVFSVQLQPGKTTRLLVDTLDSEATPPYTYRVERDTLFMTIGTFEGNYFRPGDESDDVYPTELVVEAPALVAIATSNARCQIADYKSDALTIQQAGMGGRVILDKVTIGQLTAMLSGKNQLTVAAVNNRIGQATITLLDSSRFHQYKDFEKGLTLNASPGASVRLTGKAMKQAKE